MISCRSITASILFTAIGCAGCVAPSDENRKQDYEVTVIDLESLPLIEHTGTIGASEFMMLFQEVCLQNFPDPDATGAAFARRGFAIKSSDLGVGEKYNTLFLKASNTRKGIAGSFGQYPIFDYGEVDDCSVEAYVTEPDSVDIESVLMALAAGTRYQTGPGFYTFNWRSADGRQAEIEVYLPELGLASSSSNEDIAERQKFSIKIQAIIAP